MLVLHLPAALADIGESDCELLGGGFFVQPVNALSSFAYVAVALAIAIAGWRARVHVPQTLVYAGLVAAIGVGSVAFHGPQPAGSRLAHDLPILLTVIFIVAHDMGVVFNRPRWALPGFVMGAAAGAVVSAVSIDAGTALTGIGVAVLAVSEAVIYRRRLRPIATRRQRRAYLVIIGVAAVAVAFWLLGRTGSPACDPDGVLQFHGLWHVVSSCIFGLWYWLAMWLTAAGPTSRTGSALSSPATAT